MLKAAIVPVVIFLTAGSLFSQGKFEVSAGIAWPEWTNLKVNYGRNFQIGVNIGLPTGNNSPYSANVSPYAIEIYYHFGGHSRHTEQPPWYLFSNLAYYNDEYQDGLYLCPRIGRSFNFSKRTGINLDAGLLLPLSEELKGFFDLMILPPATSLSVSFFIRL